MLLITGNDRITALGPAGLLGTDGTLGPHGNWTRVGAGRKIEIERANGNEECDQTPPRAMNSPMTRERTKE